MAAKDIITQGIGAPGSITYFILVGLDPLPAAPGAAVLSPTAVFPATSGITSVWPSLTGRTEAAVSLSGKTSVRITR